MRVVAQRVVDALPTVTGLVLVRDRCGRADIVEVVVDECRMRGLDPVVEYVPNDRLRELIGSGSPVELARWDLERADLTPAVNGLIVLGGWRADLAGLPTRSVAAWAAAAGRVERALEERNVPTVTTTVGVGEALLSGADRCHSGTVAKIKTRPTDEDVSGFLDSAPNERRRAEGHELRSLFERVTGEPAVMWGPSIVGFGSRPYTNTLGTNDWFVVGFSPRREAMTIYGIHDGYAASPDPLMESLGPATTGKSCVYIKRLDEIDHDVLEQLVRKAWSASADRA